ncbi:hypothetical protein IMCC26134_02355 [Verrucomicrobia bacterium IMCC26134]|jgi:ATP-dependent Lon protease|nr:hypothetical protein IMCC26134_02355 [Verrucomicrobia bacterium IMCC26134]
MEVEITIPHEVAVMTLPNLTFFPQALLPLHIFEPRYRKMLSDALGTHRLFAVAGLNSAKAGDAFEPPYRIATLGVVRACQGQDDGTSNLLLQGLTRVEFTEILGEEPYRRVRIRALASERGGSEEDNTKLRAQVSRLLSMRQRLRGEDAGNLQKFLRSIDDPDTFADLAAFNLCESSRLKQRILETLDVNKRLGLLKRWAKTEVETLRLTKTLQGRLPDDHVSDN